MKCNTILYNATHKNIIKIYHGKKNPDLLLLILSCKVYVNILPNFIIFV